MENEKHARLIPLLQVCLLVLTAGLLIYLGLQPLYREEPRRALIAMEMVANGNWWFPTQLGLPYFKKPPLFNWVLILAAKVWGGFDEFPLRLVTVLSTLGIGGLVGLVMGHYVSKPAGWATACLWIAAGGILFDFSMLAEIDLFFSLLVFCCFLSIFYFTQTRQWIWLFLLAYGFAALGTLTKGLPAIVFIGLTLPGYLIFKGEWRKLLHPAHVLGIGLFILLVGGYLYQYQQSYPVQDLLKFMWSESSDRTVVNNGLARLGQHLLVFPLRMWVDLLPGGLLVLLLFQKGVRNELLQNEWITFCVLAFAINFPIYWISPGSKMRYVYMLFPLAMSVFCWAYFQFPRLHWQRKTFQILTGIAIGLLLAASIGMYWIPDLQFLPHLGWICLGSALAFTGLLLAFIRQNNLWLPYLILAVAFARILYDLTILPQRAYDTQGQLDKDLAHEIHQLVQGKPLFIKSGDQFSFTTVYYLDRLRQPDILRSTLSPSADSYFFQNKDIPPGPSWEKQLELGYSDLTVVLWYIPD